MNHPETEIVSYWFDKTKYLANIPQPSRVLVDELKEVLQLCQPYLFKLNLI